MQRRREPSCSGQVVVAATNRIDAIDEALRRRSRFDREIVIGVPDQDGRRQVLGIHTRGMPPGTGKTLMAKAVARESNANFIATKSSDLLPRWYGESEQQVSRLFARARQVAPTVIFIDEIDSLVPARGERRATPAPISAM